MNQHFIVIDIETTGLCPDRGDEITEIGALKVNAKTFEIVDKFSSLINIDGPVPLFITNLTGITRTMLDQEGHELNIVLKYLSKFCVDSKIYAHNAKFDKKFIRHFYRLREIEFVESEWIDTISVFKQAWPGRKTYKLESLILDHKLATKEDHRAVSDALHTLELLRKAKGNN